MQQGVCRVCVGFVIEERAKEEPCFMSNLFYNFAMPFTCMLSEGGG